MTAEDLVLAVTLLKTTYSYKSGRLEYETNHSGMTIWNKESIAGEFFTTEIIRYFTPFILYFAIENNKVVLKIF